MLASFVKLIIIALVVIMGYGAYVFHQSHQARADLITSQRMACERGKLDRRANADFQTAHKEYILSVTSAKSVKEDVKKAARKAVRVYKRTSRDLRRRSKINCNKAFPKESWLP